MNLSLDRDSLYADSKDRQDAHAFLMEICWLIREGSALDKLLDNETVPATDVAKEFTSVMMESGSNLDNRREKRDRFAVFVEKQIENEKLESLVRQMLEQADKAGIERPTLIQMIDRASSAENARPTLTRR